ncbi:MAG: hypothetical protein R3A11_04150 [Bdellovibrionota bacterium]
MKILVLLIFVGLIIMSMSVLFFLFTLKNRDIEHVEQLSIMPLDSEEENGTNSDRIQ